MKTTSKHLIFFVLALFLQRPGSCQSLGALAATATSNFLNGPSPSVLTSQSLSQASSGLGGASISLASGSTFVTPTPSIGVPLPGETVTLAYSVPFWVLRDRTRLFGEIEMRIAQFVDRQRWWSQTGAQQPSYSSLARQEIDRLQRQINELWVIRDRVASCGWMNFNTPSAEVHAEIMYKDILSNNGLLMATNGKTELHNVPRSSLEGPVIATKLIYRK